MLPGRPTEADAVWRHAMAILDELGHPDADRIRNQLALPAPSPRGLDGPDRLE
jgi:hypothetical protein